MSSHTPQFRQPAEHEGTEGSEINAIRSQSKGIVAQESVSVIGQSNLGM